MSIYKFKCLDCDAEFESIEKIGTELSYCDCGKLAERDHTPQLCKFDLIGSNWARDRYVTREQKKQINKKLIESGREREIR